MEASNSISEGCSWKVPFNDHCKYHMMCLSSPEVTSRSECRGILDKENPEHTMKEAATPYNPFEEVESLHLPKLSPSVFSPKATPDKKEDKLSFRWSIEQLATLHPVDFDEALQPPLSHDLDSESEARAQEAIDHFFSQNLIVPSPWNGPTRHVIFSPNLASTAYFSGEYRNVAGGCGKNDACTQTVLTLPPTVDLMKCLGEYFLDHSFFQDGESDANSEAKERMSNSSFSLRRKLFTHGEGDAENHNAHPSPLRQVTSFSPAFSTPEKTTTCNGGNLFGGQLPCSPLAIEDFSCLSVIRHKPCFASPALSPIGQTIYRNSSVSKNKVRQVKPMTLTKRKPSSDEPTFEECDQLSPWKNEGKTHVSLDDKVPSEANRGKDTFSYTDYSKPMTPDENFNTTSCSMEMQSPSGFVSVSMLSVSQLKTHHAVGECDGDISDSISKENTKTTRQECAMEEAGVSSWQNHTSLSTGYQTGSMQVTSELSRDTLSGFRVCISPVGNVTKGSPNSRSTQITCNASLSGYNSWSLRQKYGSNFRRNASEFSSDLTLSSVATKSDLMSCILEERDEREESEKNVQLARLKVPWKPCIFSTPTKHAE